MNKIILIVIVLIVNLQTLAQENKVISPTVLFPSYFKKTIPLRDIQSPPPNKYSSTKDIWNLSKAEFPAFQYPTQRFNDPVLQNFNGSSEPAKQLISESVLSNPGYGIPPDAQGDVGPHHYFHAVNVSFVVLDKSGKTLYGPSLMMTLWQDFPNINTTHGDPISIYDHLADRWLVSIMASVDGGPVYYELIAVSESSDPLGSWYAYAYELDGLPDYPKFGLWHNGYYWAGNIYNLSTNDWIGASAFAIDKDAMISGDPDAAMLRFRTIPAPGLMDGPFSFLPSNLTSDVQSTDIPNYFLYVKDDVWGYPEDFISVWECHVDWDDTVASSFAEVAQLPTAPFDANMDNFTYITQPDPDYKLQSLANRLMFRLDFRHFEDYDVMVTNHTVDCDASDHAGVRWYELRDYGSGWTIYQQGTYAPDSDHRWMGSASIDEEGNIALGYSVSSSTTHPSVRATGRRAGDILGIMTVPEFSIMEGSGSQTWLSDRWGDYTSMSLDPVDQSTFWYINQYYPSNSNYNWHTALGGFYLSNDAENHTFIEPDTLFFTNPQQVSDGLELYVINANELNASIRYNDTYGTVWGEDISWYVNSYNQSPYFINAADTHVYNITAVLNDQLASAEYYYDTMLIMTSLDTHNVIIAFSDSLLLRTDETQMETLSDLKIFPNPAYESVNISFTLNKKSITHVSIKDLQGRLIKRVSPGILMPGRQKFDIDLDDDFSAGVHFVIIETDKSSLSRKLIILK